MILIGELRVQTRVYPEIFSCSLIRQRPKREFRKMESRDGHHQAFSASGNHQDDNEFERGSKRLHLQHPKQRLSTRRLCSKPRQLREKPEKDRAGYQCLHESMTFQREDHDNLQNIETGHPPIFVRSGRIHIRSTHFVGDGCC